MFRTHRKHRYGWLHQRDIRSAYEIFKKVVLWHFQHKSRLPNAKTDPTTLMNDETPALSQMQRKNLHRSPREKYSDP